MPNSLQAGYNQPARWLHWLIAGLLVLQFVLAEMAEEAEGSPLTELALWANHKSVGITVLMLAVLRLGWRLWRGVPEAEGPRWQIRLAGAAHALLYGLMLALPITGWLMSSASAYSVSWFNLVVLPDLIGPSDSAEHLLEDVHETLAKLLFVVALLHVAAALWHALIRRDGVFAGMWHTVAAVLSALVMLAGLWLLGPAKTVSNSDTDRTAATTSAAAQTTGPAPAAAQASELPLWVVDHEASRIEFTAEQAGAPFTGTFDHWQASIQFDGANLADSTAEVVIDLHSVQTGDEERDATLLGAEWFRQSQAVFRASEFQPVATGGYSALNATLDFGAGALPVSFEFEVQAGSPVLLTGRARLDRLQLGVGTGDWVDTTWVGQFVDVEVTVRTLD